MLPQVTEQECLAYPILLGFADCHNELGWFGQGSPCLDKGVGLDDVLRSFPALGLQLAYSATDILPCIN